MEYSIRNLNICFGNHFTLDIDSLNIDTNKITCILGRNGCGKSTLIKAMAGIIPYSQGSICLDNQEISKIKPQNLARTIAFLSQKHSDISDFTVKELISLGRFPHRKSFSKMTERDYIAIQNAIKLTGIGYYIDRKIHSLSGGEMQRVWLAFALVQEPKVLFLDEPATYLDIAFQFDLLKLLKRLNREKGIGVISVMHDISHVLWVSDDVVMMKNGTVYDSGPVFDIMTSDNIEKVLGVKCRIAKPSEHELSSVVFSAT